MNADPKKMTHNHHNPVSKLIVPISVAIILVLLLVIAPTTLAQGQVIETGAPVCTIVYYPGYTPSSLGSDWKLLDGSSISKLTYPQLFNCIGYVYGGSGDNFNLPNLTGRFILAATNVGGGYPLGAAGGESSHTLTVNEMPSHSHPIYRSSATYIAYGSSMGWPGVSQSNYGETTLSAGGGAAHNNMPPYSAAWAMIKAKPTYVTVTVSLTQVITSTQIVSVTQVVTMNDQIPYSVYTTTLSSGDVFAVERRETYGEKYTNSLLFLICFLLIVNIVVTSIRSRR